jgi:hypothetical protein
LPLSVCIVSAFDLNPATPLADANQAAGPPRDRRLAWRIGYNSRFEPWNAALWKDEDL